VVAEVVEVKDHVMVKMADQVQEEIVGTLHL
jgi:hypothetical protein